MDTVANRFVYHAPDEAKKLIHEGLRNACAELAGTLDAVLPDGREKSLAITNLEQTMFLGERRRGPQVTDNAKTMTPGVDYPTEGTKIVTDPPASIGRIIHVRLDPGQCVAAIVTGVLADGAVAATIFEIGRPPEAFHSVHANTWHWPERV